MNNGEIWLINLDPTIGAEIQKIRPAIIVSSNKIGVLPLCQQYLQFEALHLILIAH